MHEEQRDHLRALADSINESARMARATNSLLLFVALYLALTLLSTTDENLLRNGQVVLPQVGAGISVVQSYVLAPLVFLYLHVQALVLLAVLARKERQFDAVLREAFSDSVVDAQVKRKEYRDWLPAFALVQAFQGDPGLSNIARVLTWLATEAIPLALLFAIDISFLRYQSGAITWIHHGVVLADLLLVFWFNRRVFGRRPATTWGRVSTGIRRTLTLTVRRVFDRRPATTWGRVSTWSRRALALTMRRVFGRKPATMWGHISTWTRTALALTMMGILLFFAHPPDGTEHRQYIWRHDGQMLMDKTFVMNLFGGGNLLDTGPCRWWRVGCRYLNVSHLGDHAGAANAESDSVPDPSADENRERSHRGSVSDLRLSKRNLRFAIFRHARLQGADFQGARLQGADFDFAQLQNADLAGAHMQRATLTKARLQGAVLAGARLQRANLSEARLRGADLYMARLQGATLDAARLQEASFRSAELQGADLQRAHLQGAILRGAQLHRANLERAQLQGAVLWDANLSGSNLTRAHLQGAELNDASLRGANLAFARMQAVDFVDTRLEGTNLRKARLLCSSGVPAEWQLAWMPKVTYKSYKVEDLVTDGEFDEKLEELLDLSTDDIGTITIPYEDDWSVQDHLRRRLKNCPKRPFSGAGPGEKDLVVHSGRLPHEFGSWPSSATTDDAYWRSWAKWTVEFACESEYNARSSMERWCNIESRFGKAVPDTAASLVRNALIDARSSAHNCPGLSAIPDDDSGWTSFLDCR